MAVGRGEASLGAGGLAAMGLLGAAFALALFFNGMHIPLLSLATAALVVFVALALAPGLRRGWGVPRSGALFWLVVFWVFLAVSLAWSTVIHTSHLYYWWISALPLTAFGLLLAPDPGARTRFAFRGVAAASGVLALWALVQFFAFPEAFGYRAQGPLLNPNNLAGLLNLILLPLLAGFLRGRDTGRRWVLFGLSLLLFAGMTATQSRGGLIGLALGLAVLVGLGGGLRAGNWRPLLAWLGAAALVFAVMDGWSGAGLGQRVESLGAVGAQSSVQTRVHIWQATWAMIQDHPWLGTGLGTFFLYYPQYRHPADGSGGFYAHMDPLQFWAETGVLGPVLFYAFLLAVLVMTLRAVGRLPRGAPQRLGVAGPFAGLLAVAVHTHITFHLYVLPILIAGGIVLAAWHLACEEALGRSRAAVALPPDAHPAVWRGIVAGMVLLVFLSAGSPGVADRALAWGRQAVTDGEIQKALGHFHVARALAPASDSPFALGAEIRRAALAGGKESLDRDTRRQLYRQALRFLRRAEANNPVRPAVNATRAELFLAASPDLVADATRRAERQWRRALGKDPRFLEARFALAALYRRQGRLAEAERALAAGLKWPYPRTRPVPLYLKTARLRSRLGDPGGARELARRAMERLPQGSEAATAIAEHFALDPGEGRHGAP
jgi:O-antigen ligase